MFPVAFGDLETAFARSPYLPFDRLILVDAYMDTRQPARAIDLLLKNMDIQDEKADFKRYILARAYIQNGQLDKAQEVFNNKQWNDHVKDPRSDLIDIVVEGLSSAEGRFTAARKLDKYASEGVQPDHYRDLAWAYAQLGDRQNTLLWMEKAVSGDYLHADLFTYTCVDALGPEWQNLRQHAAEVNATLVWQAKHPGGPAQARPSAEEASRASPGRSAQRLANTQEPPDMAKRIQTLGEIWKDRVDIVRKKQFAPGEFDPWVYLYEPAKAQEMLKSVPEKFKAHLEPHSYAIQGNFEAAANLQKELVQKAPEELSPLLQLIEFRIGERNFDLARLELRRAQELGAQPDTLDRIILEILAAVLDGDHPPGTAHRRLEKVGNFAKPVWGQFIGEKLAWAYALLGDKANTLLWMERTVGGLESPDWNYDWGVLPTLFTHPLIKGHLGHLGPEWAALQKSAQDHMAKPPLPAQQDGAS
jgi:tetratricopeptide (TPR) repeat protein